MYDVSVLSGIPASVVDMIPLEPLPTRLQPLFSVGVHEMSELGSGSRVAGKEDDPGYGWIACTTDDILGHKTNLYDTLITLPPPHSTRAAERVWPRISTSKGGQIKATQRDYRRYRTLRRDLHNYPRAVNIKSPYASATDPEASPAMLPELNTQETLDDASSSLDQKIIEPQSWSALAYSSFMWWASAGENRTDLSEESDHDSGLLQDTSSRYPTLMQHPNANGRSPQRSQSTSHGNGKAKSPGASEGMPEAPVGQEMAIIAYFHRLTSLIFKVLAEAIDGEVAPGQAQDAGIIGAGDQEATGSNTESGEHEPLIENDEKVYISGEAMARMGLDVWSDSDRQFVEEMIGFYWGREAHAETGRIDCCGVRIC